MNTTQPKVLIVGCGDVGRRIAYRAHSQKMQVYTVNRNITKLSTDYHRLTWDIGSNMIVDLPITFDAVFYTAAPDQRSPDSYTKVYLHGLMQIQDILQRAKRVVFASSTGVYHQKQGQEVTESSPTKPTSYTGATLLEAESWLSQNIANATTIRLSGLYSKDRSQIRKRFAGDGYIEQSRISNRIHVEDAAAIFMHVAFMNNPAPLYLGSDPTPVMNWEICRHLAHQNNEPFDTPKPKTPTNKKIISQKIQDTGFAFSYPSFKEGLSA